MLCKSSTTYCNVPNNNIIKFNYLPRLGNLNWFKITSKLISGRSNSGIGTNNTKSITMPGW